MPGKTGKVRLHPKTREAELDRLKKELALFRSGTRRDRDGTGCNCLYYRRQIIRIAQLVEGILDDMPGSGK